MARRRVYRDGMPSPRPSSPVARLSHETELQLAWAERFAERHADLAARCRDGVPAVDDVVALLDTAVAGLRAQAELLSRQADVAVAMHDELHDLRLAIREVLVAGMPALAAARRTVQVDEGNDILAAPRVLTVA